MNLKVRLSLMNFLEFAVWGAYLTCMGNYLGIAGLGDRISWFYAIQGIVSIFMPTLMGIVADKYIQPQLLVARCSGRVRSRTDRQVAVHCIIHAERCFLYAYYRIDKHDRLHYIEE